MKFLISKELSAFRKGVKNFIDLSQSLKFQFTLFASYQVELKIKLSTSLNFFYYSKLETQ